jgi:hypothetical protein
MSFQPQKNTENVVKCSYNFFFHFRVFSNNKHAYTVIFISHGSSGGYGSSGGLWEQWWLWKQWWLWEQWWLIMGAVVAHW